MKTDGHAIYFFLFLLFAPIPGIFGADSPPAIASASPEIPGADRVYYLQIRVIFAGQTGIYGNVIPELTDMRETLTKNFKYPSYELANTIRLSLFGEEEATAMVFPDHYLRVIPKGAASGDRLKAKVELYYSPQSNETRTRLEVGEAPQKVQFQEKSPEGSHSPIFPIAGSAMFLDRMQWEAFGGVPARVSGSGRVSSNTLSSSPLSQPNVNPPAGASKFLILGITLDEVKK